LGVGRALEVAVAMGVAVTAGREAAAVGVTVTVGVAVAAGVVVKVAEPQAVRIIAKRDAAIHTLKRVFIKHSFLQINSQVCVQFRV
jgi:type IV secretory pathway TrbD component